MSLQAKLVQFYGALRLRAIPMDVFPRGDRSVTYRLSSYKIRTFSFFFHGFLNLFL